MTGTACIAVLLNLGLSAAFGQAPAPRPAFDVASVKPVADDRPAGLKAAMEAVQSAMPAGAMQRRGNNVSMRNRSLLNLIAAAYRVKATQVSGPSWMSDQLFDVDSRGPPEGGGEEQPT